MMTLCLGEKIVDCVPLLNNSGQRRQQRVTVFLGKFASAEIKQIPQFNCPGGQHGHNLADRFFRR